MTDVLPESMADLLELADASLDGTDCMTSAIRALRAFKPSLLFLADADGEAIAADDFRSETSLDTAGPLAAHLARLLPGNETCRLEIDTNEGPRLAIALRLPECACRGILGCLLDPSQLPDETPDETQTAVIVCAAAAWASARNKANEVRLHTQAEHLAVEHEVLRASHTRATTAAIEEHEERLREQEEHMGLLQAVMMMAADGIVTINENSAIESFNEAAGWIFGYTSEEVIGKNVSILMPSPHREQHDRYLAEYLGSRHTGVFNYAREVTGQRKDGTTFPLELAVSEVCLGDRRIFTAIVRDITERKRAEDDLKRLHLQKEMILKSAAEGIFGLDREGNAVFVNPAAAEMLGWQAEELIGKPHHALFHHTKPRGQPYPPQECPINKTLCGATASRVDDEVFWRKDGTSFPVEYTSTPIQEGDEIAGAVVTFRDIAERRRLERQLAQAQKLESIGQLAAGIAHEINTPTQYIGDNARFLRDTFGEFDKLLSTFDKLLQANKDDSVTDDLVAEVEAAVEEADMEYLLEEIPKAIEQSLEGLGRVATIVHSMKEFSHPGGKQKQAIDLNRAIESTLTVSRNEWKYVADAVTEFDPHLPLVSCLPAEINQVILNLIINAAHAIAEKLGEDATQKGTITVSTRHDGDWVETRVSDTGAGIPERNRPKLFDPFFTTKQVGRGTGQGLAIAHAVVTEKHGGSLFFETEVGQGTTFIMRLPVSQEPSPASGVESE